MPDKRLYWFGRAYHPFTESTSHTEVAKALEAAYKKAMAALRSQFEGDANIRPEELELRLEVSAFIKGRDDDEQSSGVVS